MKIKYVKTFLKSYNKLDQKIKDKFDERLLIFGKNPFERILNNHALTGKYTGFRSINITGDYRAIFQDMGEGKYEFIAFVDIGTHSDLYK